MISMASYDHTSTTTSSGLSTATPEWGTEAVLLKDFTSKRSVPGFAKIVKGSYMTLGASKFSFQKQHHEVFLYSVKVGFKVLAHCVRRVEATNVVRRGGYNVYSKTRLYALDQRLAIPFTYQGWFEIVSEDGQSARPITSVLELSRVKPERCLVRENMKAYLQGDDGKQTFDKSRVVLAGEQLILNGEITLPSLVESKRVKLLRCIDSKGETIFLSFDQVGAFTPIAREDDVCGVFNIRDIVARFRLPMTVKLIQGVRPKVDPARFTGLIRLDWVYQDETAFVCPVEKNHVRLLPVPSDTPVYLVSAVNESDMKTSDLFMSMMQKCSRMVTNYNNTLHLIVQVPEVISKSKSRSSNVFSTQFQSETLGPSSAKAKAKELRRLDEIDDLYAYVRDGGPPPTKTKFTYDSDEESYWEEPAYEPIDEFQARLKALDAGERVSYPSKYQPQDPKNLPIVADFEHRRFGNPKGLTNGASNGLLHQEKNRAVGPPLPPRPLDFPVHPDTNSAHHDAEDSSSNEKTPTNTTAPNLSSRQNSRQENFVTIINSTGFKSSQSTIGITPNPPVAHTEIVQRSKTFHQSATVSNDAQGVRRERPLVAKQPKGSPDSTSNSGSSGGHGQAYQIARDFKDSDISSLSKGGSSGSSGRVNGNLRKKIQTMYL